MPIPRSQKSLADLFRKLGAPNPASWARSQTEEGINQLHRYLFLRQAWSRIVSEQDDAWIDRAMAESDSDPNGPFSGVGHALARMLASGVSRNDVIDCVRGMQAKLLFDFCHLLDDPSLAEREVCDLGWTLVETDAKFNPTSKSIGGLHESVIGTDPTGREMRPRMPTTQVR